MRGLKAGDDGRLLGKFIELEVEVIVAAVTVWWV